MSGGAIAGSSAAAAGAAAAAAIAQAIKASGGIVRVEPTEFKKILDRGKEMLVAFAIGGFWGKNYQYLTNYKGLYFFCKSKEALRLPGTVETIQCEKIWIPGS